MAHASSLLHAEDLNEWLRAFLCRNPWHATDASCKGRQWGLPWPWFEVVIGFQKLLVTSITGHLRLEGGDSWTTWTSIATCMHVCRSDCHCLQSAARAPEGMDAIFISGKPQAWEANA